MQKGKTRIQEKKINILLKPQKVIRWILHQMINKNQEIIAPLFFINKDDFVI